MLPFYYFLKIHCSILEVNGFESHLLKQNVFPLTFYSPAFVNLFFDNFKKWWSRWNPKISDLDQNGNILRTSEQAQSIKKAICIFFSCSFIAFPSHFPSQASKGLGLPSLVDNWFFSHPQKGTAVQAALADGHGFEVNGQTVLSLRTGVGQG